MSETVGGEKANRTGRYLEKCVGQLLEHRRYTKQKNKDFNQSSLPDSPSYWYQKPVCTGIYGSLIKVDYLVHHPTKHGNLGPLILEAKWQQSKGTVDEKLPYLIHNVQEHYPYRTLLILDGQGYRRGAKEWVLNHVSEDKLIGVYSMAEFLARVHDGFL